MSSKFFIEHLKLKHGRNFVLRELRYSLCCGLTLPISSHFSSAFRTEKEAADEQYAKAVEVEGHCHYSMRR
jgi:hypothetical protein